MSDISQGPGWRSIRRNVAPGQAPSGDPPRTSHVAGRTKRLWRLSGPIGAIVLVSGIIVASPGFSGSASADPTAQTISFAALANMQLGDAPFTVSATATSGLPVSFSIPSSASGVCTSTGTDGSTITLVGAGTCTVQADQAGDSTYAAGPVSAAGLHRLAGADGADHLVRSVGQHAIRRRTLHRVGHGDLGPSRQFLHPRLRIGRLHVDGDGRIDDHPGRRRHLHRAGRPGRRRDLCPGPVGAAGLHRLASHAHRQHHQHPLFGFCPRRIDLLPVV